MANIIQGDGYIIENLNPQIATISLLYPDKPMNTKNAILLDFGDDRKTGDNTMCSFIIISDTKKVTTTSASCGCTKAYFQGTEDPKKQHLIVDYDTHKITKNVSKLATFFFDNGHTDFVKFNIVMNRK